MSLSDDLLAHALALGFDLAGIIPLGRPQHAAAFADWLAANRHGEMAYLAARAAERLDPPAWLPDAASLILLAASYNPGVPPPAWRDPAYGQLARYAWGPDYHDLLRPRLHALDAFIRERTGRTLYGRACVDTAPLLERDFAEQAGLGFIGRNTCLITPGLGSWTFLAALATPEGLDQGRKRKDEDSSALPASSFVGCGHCTRCLDACPTRAFVGPYVLDARRCISYLTIELRGPIPRELRPLMGSWIFGCDVCQEVCPYNRAVPPAAAGSGVPQAPLFLARRSMAALELLELLTLDEARFRARFRGTAILRAKRGGFVRNACIAAGNWGDPRALPGLIPLLADAEPLVRGHAAWALGRIGGATAMNALRDALQREDNSWVREEMESARI